MRLLKQFKLFMQQKLGIIKPGSAQLLSDAERIARLERNYIVLLKRVLEMDGVQLVASSKANNLNAKILQTATDEKNNGLNEHKPTLH